MLKHRARAVFLLIFAALVGYYVFASSQPGGSKPFRLGLDLSGGTHLVYQADVTAVDPNDIADSMSALRDVVERRVNMFGVSEPLVQTEEGKAFGSNEIAHRLIVELPGITDTEEAKKSIGSTPRLEFKLADSAAVQSYVSSNSADTTSPETAAGFISLFKDIGLTGRMVQRAQLEFNPTTNEPTVGLNFTDEGRTLFGATTKANVGDYIGIFLDGNLISWPTVREPILDGRAQISGSFDLDTAKGLVRDLNYGALPIPISLISEQTIGPTLGQAAVKGGINAGAISFLIIAIFLIFWYRLPGLVAVVALAVYTALMLLLFKIIPVTLTAAGIAGFILSMGMAVDANILIFERMKEELARGRGIWDAMHEGFARAWLSIRDSNISSIITGAILYYFGSTSVVTGFALVFVLGVVVSMFTAITASRLLLYAVAPSRQTKASLFLINSGIGRKRSEGQIN